MDIREKEYLTTKELPESERPYEKCERFGAGSLSDAELLAVIIRSGARRERSCDLAARILGLSDIRPGLKGLNYLTRSDLLKLKGIGRVKAVQLLCVVELARRMARAKGEELMKFASPDAVAACYMEELRHLTREESVVLFLDAKNRRLSDMVIATGTVNASIMSPREIFLNALERGAVGIILIHNHPSGDPEPSSEDIAVTRRIRDAGNLIGIRLMDHIIIGDNIYISFKEKGLL